MSSWASKWVPLLFAGLLGCSAEVDPPAAGADSGAFDAAEPDSAGQDSVGQDTAGVADTAADSLDASDSVADSDTKACAPPLVAPGLVQKISHLELAFDATGCDRNGDGVADNALGAGLSQIGGSFNQRLAENLASGELVMLLSAEQFRSDGQSFPLTLLRGALGPLHLSCPPTAATADCGYQVLPASFDTDSPLPTCPARNLFANATVKGGWLEAGGQGEALDVPLPTAALSLSLRMLDVRIRGQVTSAIGPDGKEKWLATSGGMLCGVLTKPALHSAIDALPDEQVAARGFSKPVLKAMLSSLLVADVAVGGTELNAWSATIRLASVPGHIVGPKD